MAESAAGEGVAVATPVERIAVFGGSFDPPHVGHILLATWALSAGAVDRLIVVPTHTHAFGKESAPYEHRVRMLEIAFDIYQENRVEVSRVEAQLPPPSYTVRTLEALALEHPGAKLRLLVGADVLPDLPRWREMERVEALAPLLVGGRSGHARSTGDRHLGAHVPNFPEVSSTAVRTLLASGGDASSLLPERVLDYIRSQGLYR